MTRQYCVRKFMKIGPELTKKSTKSIHLVNVFDVNLDFFIVGSIRFKQTTICVPHIMYCIMTIIMYYVIMPVLLVV